MLRPRLHPSRGHHDPVRARLRPFFFFFLNCGDLNGRDLIGFGMVSWVAL